MCVPYPTLQKKAHIHQACKRQCQTHAQLAVASNLPSKARASHSGPHLPVMLGKDAGKQKNEGRGGDSARLLLRKLAGRGAKQGQQSGEAQLCAFDDFRIHRHEGNVRTTCSSACFGPGNGAQTVRRSHFLVCSRRSTVAPNSHHSEFLALPSTVSSHYSPCAYLGEVPRCGLVQKLADGVQLLVRRRALYLTRACALGGAMK